MAYHNTMKKILGKIEEIYKESKDFVCKVVVDGHIASILPLNNKEAVALSIGDLVQLRDGGPGEDYILPRPIKVESYITTKKVKEIK
jgi:hypothetical protein